MLKYATILSYIDRIHAAWDAKFKSCATTSGVFALTTTIFETWRLIQRWVSAASIALQMASFTNQPPIIGDPDFALNGVTTSWQLLGAWFFIVIFGFVFGGVFRGLPFKRWLTELPYMNIMNKIFWFWCRWAHCSDEIRALKWQEMKCIVKPKMRSTLTKSDWMKYNRQTESNRQIPMTKIRNLAFILQKSRHRFLSKNLTIYKVTVNCRQLTSTLVPVRSQQSAGKFKTGLCFLCARFISWQKHGSS